MPARPAPRDSRTPPQAAPKKAAAAKPAAAKVRGLCCLVPERHALCMRAAQRGGADRCTPPGPVFVRTARRAWVNRRLPPLCRPRWQKPSTKPKAAKTTPKTKKAAAKPKAPKVGAT